MTFIRHLKVVLLIGGALAAWFWPDPVPELPPGLVQSRDAPLNYRSSVRATGEVVRVRREGTYEVRLRLLALEKRGRRRSAPARLLWNPRSLELLQTPPFLALLRINQYDLVAGCRLDLALSGRGRLIALPDNAYGRYLRGRGLRAQLKLSRRYHVRAIHCEQRTAGGHWQSAVRTTLQQRLGLDYKDRRYGFVLGLLLGNSGFLHKDLKRRVRELGILHLFAASGLHLGILYACLFFPLAAVRGRRDPWACVLPLGPCLLYLLALDAPVSLLRAFSFVSVHAAQSLLHRHVPVSELLLNSALVVLMLAPREFCSVGTALSFGAVGGILYFARLIREALFRRPGLRRLAGPASVSLAASIFTVPIIVCVFDQHPALGLPANIVLVPLMGLLLPLLVCGGVLLEVVGWLASYTMYTNEFAAMAQWCWLSLAWALQLFLWCVDAFAWLNAAVLPEASQLHQVLWRFAGVQVLPLVASTLVTLGVVVLYHYERQNRVRLVGRAMLLIGVVLLGPPGVYLQWWWS